jgi:hypothetical protein
MNQAERDRPDALKRAKKKLITQKQAAEEIGVTERQIRRLLRKLRWKGDRAVIHELRGRASNRKLPAEMEQRPITVLSDAVYRGFRTNIGGKVPAQAAPDYGEQRDTATMDGEGDCGEPVGAVWCRCTTGGRGGTTGASWCGGTPPTTTGWKDVGSRSI